MGQVVNLRTARKRARRLKAAEQAQQNRVTHGRSKADATLASARTAKAERDLDAHRLDDKGDDP